MFSYWANTLYLDDAIQAGWIAVLIWYPLEKTKTKLVSQVRCCTADFDMVHPDKAGAKSVLPLSCGGEVPRLFHLACFFSHETRTEHKG